MRGNSKLHRQHSGLEFMPSVGVGFAGLLIWEIACILLRIHEFILPRPSAILAAIFHDAPNLLENAAVTMLEAFLGFLLASLFALGLALSMFYVHKLDRAVMPFAIALKTTPIVAMAPLLLLWLGNGLAPKVASSALICFFPVLVNSLRGLGSTEEGEIDLFRCYGATKTQALVKLRFFRAAPYILSALKASSSLAIVGAIVGEFVGANHGIGYLILVASYHLETVKMFAALTFGAVCGIIFYASLTWIEKKLIFWAVESQKRNESVTSKDGRRDAR